MNNDQNDSKLERTLQTEHNLNDLQVEIYMTTLKTEIGMTTSEIQQMFPKLEGQVNLLNEILAKNLFEIKVKGDQQFFKGIDLTEVSKLNGLSMDQRMVYNAIKESNNEGIWVRNIKKVTNLSDHQIQQSLKHLEKQYFIKAIKSVKNPAQKVYILYDLTPSADITGGTFFTDQAFDDQLVAGMINVCLHFIKDKSLADDGKLYPIDYDMYPTLPEIHDFVRDNVPTDKDLSEEDTLQILKVMELEQLIICLDASVPIKNYNNVRPKESKIRYKAMNTDTDHIKDSLTNLPCGACPTMDMCAFDGMINPNSNDYFKDWLN